jgi:Sensors of blue-light using FAD
MALIQLTYASQPFGFDGPTLAGILLDARRCNARDGITGALICRDDLFLQMLEGPEDKVEATYRRIIKDDRHLEVRALSRRAIADDSRIFAHWAMRDDPARSWVWTRAELDDGALDHTTEGDVIAMFERLASLPA